MEFTNDKLVKMDFKKNLYNDLYRGYYLQMADDPTVLESSRYIKKAIRIKNCMNFWLWDAYHCNKILDLKQVNRCMNNRFCPNCKLLDVSKLIHKIRPILLDTVEKGYDAYMLTLTVPNCHPEELDCVLQKMSKNFSKLFQFYSGQREHKFHNSFDIYGGIRVLEITYNSMSVSFHPHYHCLIFIKHDIDLQPLFDKVIQGRYSNKRGCYNMKSLADIEISKVWTMLFKDIRLTEYNFNHFDVSEIFECDLTLLDEKGIYEILKYTFKDSDITDYKVFKCLEEALTFKRLRQGFGFLYRQDFEYIEIGEVQELELLYQEEPEKLITLKIKELYTDYENYKKISRFDANIDENLIKKDI